MYNIFHEADQLLQDEENGKNNNLMKERGRLIAVLKQIEKKQQLQDEAAACQIICFPGQDLRNHEQTS